jgi:hypothetical protein
MIAATRRRWLSTATCWTRTARHDRSRRGRGGDLQVTTASCDPPPMLNHATEDFAASQDRGVAQALTGRSVDALN